MRKMAIIAIVLIIVVLLLMACGGRNAPSSENDDATNNSSSTSNAAPAIATMPSAQFTSVGQQSVAGQQSVTTTTVSATITASETVQTVAPDLARGARAYEKNKCADCHGAQGEGVADKGSAIAGTALTLSEFENTLRTGGGVGNTHIFGPSAVSRSGMAILYQYVQSLAD